MSIGEQIAKMFRAFVSKIKEQTTSPAFFNPYAVAELNLLIADTVKAILMYKDIARGLELLAMEKDGKLVVLDEDQSFPTPRDKGPLCLLHFTTQIREANFKRVKPLPEEQDNGEEGTASEAPHI